jgi:FKBP-type peptidyl-prolyl cis-trans isomerase (trigger factor)
MKALRGLELLDEREGVGQRAGKGDRVVYNTRVFLNRGDRVTLDEAQRAVLPPEAFRVVDGEELIDRRTTLGRREVIAGVEHALVGMRPGGYRKVRISPHLAYRERGVEGIIPPNAVLVVEIFVREIIRPDDPRPA